MAKNRQTFLNSIHTGIPLRHTQTLPSNRYQRSETSSNTGRPLTLMEQMKLPSRKRGGFTTLRSRGRRRGRGFPRRRTRLDEHISIWYYVSKYGTTLGPYTIKQMKSAYYNKDLDKTSYVWNGTTVAQWTPISNLKDLLEQVGESSTGCEYVWCCTKCNKVETNPQICKQEYDIFGSHSKCLGAAVWKLRCVLCAKIANEDNICPRCNTSLQHVHETALKEAQKKEDTRQNKMFLRACTNMNNNRQNMRLLVSGLVSELKDTQLYQNFPIEIYECMLMFGFNFDLMDDIPDSFLKPQPLSLFNQSLFSDGNSDGNSVVELLENGDGQKMFVEGKYLYDCFRKVWTIQILNHVPKTMIDFSVGIANARKNKYIMKIKALNIGDVISMLYLKDYSGVGTLSIAVNGKMKDVSISEISCANYKLVVVIKNPIKIKLIH